MATKHEIFSTFPLFFKIYLQISNILIIFAAADRRVLSALSANVLADLSQAIGLRRFYALFMCVIENNNNSKQITIMNKQIFILAMAAFGFVACSSDETVAVNQNDSDAITFRPIVNGATRAADIDAGSGT